MTAPVVDTRIAAAQARAAAARARLGGTLDTLKRRVSPQALAQEAADTVKDRGLALASAARERPAAAIGIAATIVLFLARGRIAHWLRPAATASNDTQTPNEGPRS